MREKKLYVIFTFSKTTDAVAMEKNAEKEGIPGRLIPLPTEISAGCGLAWRMTAQDFEVYGNKITTYEKIISLNM